MPDRICDCHVTEKATAILDVPYTHDSDLARFPPPLSLLGVQGLTRQTG